MGVGGALFPPGQLEHAMSRSTIQKKEEHHTKSNTFAMQAFEADKRCKVAFHLPSGVPKDANELLFLAIQPELRQAAIDVCLPVDTLLPRLLVDEQERSLPASLCQQVTSGDDLCGLLLAVSAHRLCRGISATHYDAFVSYMQDIGKPVANAQLLCGRDGQRRYMHPRCEVLVSGRDTGGSHCAACKSIIFALSSAACKWACRQSSPTPGGPQPAESMTRQQLVKVVADMEQEAQAHRQRLEGQEALMEHEQQVLAQNEDNLEPQRRHMVEVQPAQHAVLRVSKWTTEQCT